jgi:two-component system, chemotaxis family, protein-glutamate methylesterase/glutaminase
LGPQSPPMVITQHMPRGFTARLAERLDNVCSAHVLEGREGQVLQSGHVYIAPGGYQMRVISASGQKQLRITDEDKVNGFSPSVDVLFSSVAQSCGDKSIGVILTGMGADGGRGLHAMRQAGALTIGQDEASCVVYGMPRMAYEMGAVVRQAPLSRIPSLIHEQLLHTHFTLI